MALTSNLLTKPTRNTRLDRCLVNDADHVLLNDRGDHVARIQAALLAITPGLSLGTEVSAQLYGPLTAAAVFQFKKARGILNAALRQTTPDSIVGKQTIEALDKEMLKIEAGGAKPLPTPKPAGPPILGTFAIDLIGWIPQPEVDNPLSLLPTAITSLLPSGMADPFFGGDNFVFPATTPAGMKPPARRFRAAQHLDFMIPAFGAPPIVGAKTTVPGLTTCLDKRRAAGGKVTFSLTAKLARASISVVFSPSDDWYEVLMSGVVLDPVPAAAAAALAASVTAVPPFARPAITSAVSSLATSATPSLTWSLTLRIQRGLVLNGLTAASYTFFTGTETSSTLRGASRVLAPGSDLIHGKIDFGQWPSAVIYVTFTPGGGGGPFIQPIFFSNAIGVPRPETAFILVPKLCLLRQLTW